MGKSAENNVVCCICQRSTRLKEAFPIQLVRPGIAELLRKARPEAPPDGYVCQTDLNQFRAQYIESMLAVERGELSQLEEDVIDSLRKQELVAEDLNAEFDRDLTLGERMADRIAVFGGSWVFIGTFFSLLGIWIAANSITRFWAPGAPFDPYPFILLNLILSCLASIQAPIIMMSQNRQESKDRLRSEHDYRVNLKAELEIRHLNAKMDMLITTQWQRLLEIQQIQTDLMQELAGRRSSTPKHDER